MCSVLRVLAAAGQAAPAPGAPAEWDGMRLVFRPRPEVRVSMLEFRNLDAARWLGRAAGFNSVTRQPLSPFPAAGFTGGATAGTFDSLR